VGEPAASSHRRRKSALRLGLGTITVMKTTAPDKRERTVEKRESERHMPALLVKVKTRRHKRSLRQADGTENCRDVGWQPDQTVGFHLAANGE